MGIERYREWMRQSTATEKAEVAQKARTSLAVLYQLSTQHRKASAALAERISNAINEINKKYEPDLPKVLKGDICEACNSCPYYLKECG